MEQSVREDTLRNGRLDDVLTVLVFGIALWLPIAVGLISPSAEISLAEKRRLAELPTFSLEPARLAAFPAELSRYWDDHLGLRGALIRSYARLSIGLLGRSPSAGLIVGRDGWFFLGTRAPVEQFRGLARFEPADLERWQRVLEETRDWLAERGIAYVVAIAPNKHTMYGEFLPPSLSKVQGETQLDALMRHLDAHSSLELVDLRETLRAAKQRERVYHRTDTHWNDVGAYLAYREILEAAGRQLPSLGEADPVPVRRRARRSPGLALVQSVGLERVYREETVELVPREPRSRVAAEQRRAYPELVRTQRPFAFEISDPDLPRAIVFRDSFANALIPFLSEHFERTLYIWSPDVDPEPIEAERPDVVIHVIAERFLGRTPRGIREIQERRDRRTGGDQD
jgi:alginate O-acetyltransferase complex protein AlgJ